MSDTAKATIRTTVNAVVMAVVGFVLANVFNIEARLDDPVIVAVIGVLTGVVYTASVYAVKRWPILGRVLFGINASPSYAPPPPPAD